MQHRVALLTACPTAASSSYVLVTTTKSYTRPPAAALHTMSAKAAHGRRGDTPCATPPKHHWSSKPSPPPCNLAVHKRHPRHCWPMFDLACKDNCALVRRAMRVFSLRNEIER
ncbi:hypothetical protein FB451DRAFT_1407611 [Mycena latifolia]|nr:hypothetical protein FB451DRAFT_1407611 [Mycena latifolia]